MTDTGSKSDSELEALQQIIMNGPGAGRVDLASTHGTSGDKALPETTSNAQHIELAKFFGMTSSPPREAKETPLEEVSRVNATDAGDTHLDSDSMDLDVDTTSDAERALLAKMFGGYAPPPIEHSATATPLEEVSPFNETDTGDSHSDADDSDNMDLDPGTTSEADRAMLAKMFRKQDLMNIDPTAIRAKNSSYMPVSADGTGTTDTETPAKTFDDRALFMKSLRKLEPNDPSLMHASINTADQDDPIPSDSGSDISDSLNATSEEDRASLAKMFGQPDSARINPPTIQLKNVALNDIAGLDIARSTDAAQVSDSDSDIIGGLETTSEDDRASLAKMFSSVPHSTRNGPPARSLENEAPTNATNLGAKPATESKIVWRYGLNKDVDEIEVLEIVNHNQPGKDDWRIKRVHSVLQLAETEYPTKSKVGWTRGVDGDSIEIVEVIHPTKAKLTGWKIKYVYKELTPNPSSASSTKKRSRVSVDGNGSPTMSKKARLD